jgi:hypothetical protein
MIDLTLERTELSPRELAVTFTDEKAQFISEASVYRLLRANGLLTSPAIFIERPFSAALLVLLIVFLAMPFVLRAMAQRKAI